MSFSWWSSLLKRNVPFLSRNANRAAPARRHRFRPRVVLLEDRTLLATFYVALTGLDTNLGTAASPFRTIQAGVNAAAAVADGNDVVNVAAGTYGTAGVDNSIIIPPTTPPNLSNLQLQGGWNAAFTTQTLGTTIFVPQQVPGATTPDVDVGPANVTINGFNLVFDGTPGTGGTRNGGGVQVDNSNFTLTNNTLEPGDKTAAGARNYAVVTAAGANLTGLNMNNNVFTSNGGSTFTFGTSAGGIFLNPDAGGRVTPLLISNNMFNGPNLNSALVISSVNNVMFSNNFATRAGGTAGGGLDLVDIRQSAAAAAAQTGIVITGNTLDGNGQMDFGIYLNDGGTVQQLNGVVISNNIIANSLFGNIVATAPAANVLASGTTITLNSITNTSSTVPPVSWAGTGTLDLSGNWWGVAVGADPNGVGRANINALPFSGASAVTIGAFFSSGTNTAAVGFTPPASTEMWVPKRTPAMTIVNGVIQSGVNSAAAGMTVRVAADTYAENVTISKALTLLGNQAGQNANTRFAGFTNGVNGPKADPTLETVLTAPTVNPTGGNPGANDLLRVVANNITINGLVIDGNNPALAASPIQVGTINIDARRGIQNSDSNNNFFDINNLLIENCIIQNISQRGIELSNNTTASTGNLITGNVIRNFGSDPVNGGLAIILFTNAYADITNNTIVDIVGQGLATGLQLQNFSLTGSMTWSGNNITVAQDDIGIIANLFYAPAGVLNITNNAINAAVGVTGADDLTWGIYVLSVQVGSTVTVNTNTIGATGGQFARGIDLWNLPTTNTVTVNGGSIANTLVGVVFDSIDVFFGSGAATAVNINNLAITGATVGIRVDNDPISPPPQSGTNVPGGNVVANISGGSISGAATGILVQDTTADGFTATVNLLGGTTISGSSSAGVSILGAQATATVFRSTITGNGVGISVGTGGNLGSILQETAENFITGNTTGIQVAAGAGTVQGIFDNDLSGNTTAINNLSAATLNATSNWWGVTTAAAVAAMVKNGPATTVPFLLSGTDTQPGTPGFQGDLRSTITTLTVMPSTANAGQTITFSVTLQVVTTTPPTGSVTFQNGSVIFGSASTFVLVSAGLYSLTFTSSTILAGSYTQVVAVYSGDGNYNTSTSPATTLTIIGTTPPVNSTHYIVVGAGAGGGPQVNVYAAVGGQLLASFDAFASSFTGGVTVAVGDVNGDGTPDIVVGAGAGGGPQVVVFDGKTFQMIRSFYGLASTFSGGVSVAVGNVDADGFADIIVGAGAGGGPQVTVWSGKDGSLLDSFDAFASSFNGGVRVAAGDVNGDGKADIICAAGAGGGPQVTVFNGVNLTILESFYAFASGFTGGVYVASGDLNGDGRADIVTGAGPGGLPQVTTFDGITGAILQSFYASNPNMSDVVSPDASAQSGVRVGTTTANGKVEILTGPGPGAQPQVDVFNGQTGAFLDSFFTFDPAFRGGVFVGG